MRARDEHKIETIREEAIALIVQEGFHGFSMQKLAKAANVSPATLYIYYKNKEDLLNHLYNEVQAIFIQETLVGFDPHSDFETGLWKQWQNRFQFVKKHPLYFQFQEQFKNSPLINHDGVAFHEFKLQMRTFVHNAMKHGEIKKVEPEIFWSIAYGSFYALVKFHLAQKCLMNKEFKISPAILRKAFDMVIHALKNKSE